MPVTAMWGGWVLKWRLQNIGIGKGASIKYVRRNFGILDPLPPLSAKSRNLLYWSLVLCPFLGIPPSPLGADVLNGSPLSLTGGGRGIKNHENLADVICTCPLGQKMTKKVTCLISLVEMMTRGWGGDKKSWKLGWCHLYMTFTELIHMVPT